MTKSFDNQIDNETHVALIKGDIGDGKDVLVRVHSKCLTGDVFHSARCDCGPQLDAAMSRIAAEGRGVLLYLNQEGRGIGLANKTIRLLTNNPRKFVGLQGYGLAVSEAVPLEIPASEHTRRYLKTKNDQLGHTLSSE